MSRPNPNDAPTGYKAVARPGCDGCAFRCEDGCTSDGEIPCGVSRFDRCPVIFVKKRRKVERHAATAIAEPEAPGKTALRVIVDTPTYRTLNAEARRRKCSIAVLIDQLAYVLRCWHP